MYVNVVFVISWVRQYFLGCLSSPGSIDHLLIVVSEWTSSDVCTCHFVCVFVCVYVHACIRVSVCVCACA